MLAEERDADGRVELDAALGHGDKAIEQLNWDRVRNDRDAKPEDRVRARIAYGEWLAREAARNGE